MQQRRLALHFVQGAGIRTVDQEPRIVVRDDPGVEVVGRGVAARATGLPYEGVLASLTGAPDHHRHRARALFEAADSDSGQHVLAHL